MPSAGFEPAFPAASEWPQTHASERATTGIGCNVYYVPHNVNGRKYQAFPYAAASKSQPLINYTPLRWTNQEISKLLHFISGYLTKLLQLQALYSRSEFSKALWDVTL